MLENIRVTINTSTDQVRLTFKDYVRTYDPISADTNNIIERKPDGIFAPTPNWAVLEDKPSSSVTDIDQSISNSHTHSNKAIIDDLSDDSGVLQYKGFPISDQAALNAKVDKVAGYSLVSDLEIAKLSTVQENATANRADSENADKVHAHAISDVTGLDTALETKVDKFEGYSLVADDEIDKLSTVEQNATANRPDSENAGKVHGHVIADIDDLTAKLELINQWLQVPADKKYFDFIGNRYSADGMPATVSSLSQFTRLSYATQWQSGVLVDVAANVMRIDKSQGLLIEPQRTNNAASSLVAIGTAALSLRGVGALGSEFIDVSGAINTSNYLLVASGNDNNKSISCILSNIPSEGVVINIGGSVNLCKVFPDGTSTSLNAATVYLKSTKVSSGVYVAVGVFIASSSPFRIYASSAAGVFTIDALSVEYGNSSPTSLMSRLSGQTTRAKETLVVPFTTGQTVTADKDEGVTMTIVDNNAVFEGQGYIRNVRVN